MASKEGVRLTKRNVDLAEPSPRPYFIWDTELKGYGARIDPTGAKTFIVRYRPKGQGASAPKRFVTVGRYGTLTADEARTRAKQILGAVANGDDPAAKIAEKRAAATLKDAAALFIDQHVSTKRKPSTAEGYQALLNAHALPCFGNRKIETITTSEVARLHNQLKDRPYQANRLLAVISSLYSFAESQGLVPEGFNPVKKVEKYREHRRERFLTGEELERVGSALREGETVGIAWSPDDEPQSKHLPRPENRRTLLSRQATDAIRMLIFTGARLREILDLKWENVDLERGLLLLPDSKTGRKTIVLNEAAIDILKGHPRLGAYVIAGDKPDTPRTDLKKPWAAICKHAALEGVRLHDLRHTFASIGAGASLGLPIVGGLLGHSQPQTTARYAHLDADPLRRATNIIGHRLANSMAGQNSSDK